MCRRFVSSRSIIISPIHHCTCSLDIGIYLPSSSTFPVIIGGIVESPDKKQYQSFHPSLSSTGRTPDNRCCTQSHAVRNNRTDKTNLGNMPRRLNLTWKLYRSCSQLDRRRRTTFPLRRKKKLFFGPALEYRRLSGANRWD